MAVLDHAHVSVEVITNGTAANEFDGDSDEQADTDEATVLKYIEVNSDQDFHFEIQLGQEFDCGKADIVTVCPTIDGKHLTGRCLKKPKKSTHSERARKLAGVWTGTGSDARLLHYRFSELETRDQSADDDTKLWKEKYGGLGTLKIELWRSRSIYDREASDDPQESEIREAVPENALKGAAIGVATTPTRNKAVGYFRLQIPDKTALQALMIIERSPTPVPFEDRDPEDLTREELIVLERRRRASEALNTRVKTESIKRERADTTSTPMPPLKMIRGADAVKQHIIDLDADTEEDDAAKVVQSLRGRRRLRGSKIEIIILE